MPRCKIATKQAEATYAPQERGPKTRNRPIKACFPCRNSKGKCDQARPKCSRCEEHKSNCKYLPTNLTPEQLAALNELKQTDRKIQDQRTLLAREKKSGTNVRRVNHWVGHHGVSSSHEGSTSGTEDEGFAPFSVDAVNASAYANDTSDEEPIMDMGFKFGKVSINDRIGAYQRPTADQELDFVLNSPLFDHRTSEEKAENPGIPQVEEYYDLVPDGTSYRFRPGDTYIAPISGFPFSDGPIYKSYRPTKELADTLIAHYWRCVHPVARTIHKPSFERAYGYFWEGRHTPTSTQALIFAAMFSAIVSMPKDHPAIHQFRDGQMNLSVILQSSTEALLGRAHLARTTKLETVQAAVTYLIPLCRADVGRVHSTAVASAVRIAQCIGLHKDGTECNYDAVTTHVRRMIWYELLLLDTRAYEAHGPQLLIREDSFTTKVPLNVNDDDLEQIRAPCEDSDSWTDMTLTRIRMECDTAIRRIYVDRDRIGSGDGQIPLTNVLAYIFQFRKSMKQRYFRMIDDNDPLQYYGRLNIDLHTRRMHAMMLHRYHGLGGLDKMPDRLHENLNESGIATMAIAKEIETSEGLKPWLWYAGALHQHHYALLMLVEFFMHPYRKGAAFAWNYLDWVFEVPPEQFTDPQKARRLLTKARNEMRAYLTAKRLHCPSYRRVASAAQAQGTPEYSSPTTVGAAGRLGIGPGQHASGTRLILRSQPGNANYAAIPNGIYPSPSTAQVSATMLQPQGRPLSVYGPSNDPMQGVETADPRRPFDLEWKYDDFYPPEYHTGDLHGTLNEYKPPTCSVSYDERGQFQAIASMYPGLESSEAFSRHNRAYNDGSSHPPTNTSTEESFHQTTVSIDNSTNLSAGFPTAVDSSYPVNGNFHSPFPSNGLQAASINSFGSNGSSAHGFVSGYGGEALSRSGSYTDAPTYQEYGADNGLLEMGRLIQDVPHRPGSGRMERLWHHTGISKRRKQPSLGRGSR